METRHRRGLVLVEVLSILGLSTVAIGLIMPQIQAAREAARRTQCTNNLKQFALGMHNYASAYDRLPMSAVLGKGHGNGHSGFMGIMPFLEQTAVYNAYNFSLENWDDSNATAMKVKIATFVCPSNTEAKLLPLDASEIKDHHDKVLPGKNKFGPLHYGMNWGGVRAASGAEQEKAYGPSWRGLMLTVVDPDSKEPTTNVKFADVTDGLSFTVAFSEKLDSFGWGVGGWGGSEFDVNTTPVDPGKDAMQKRVFTGSLHPKGMNIAMGDGSVRFVTNKLEQKVWHDLTTRASGEPIKGEDLK